MQTAWHPAGDGPALAASFVCSPAALPQPRGGLRFPSKVRREAGVWPQCLSVHAPAGRSAQQLAALTSGGFSRKAAERQRQRPRRRTDRDPQERRTRNRDGCSSPEAPSREGQLLQGQSLAPALKRGGGFSRLQGREGGGEAGRCTQGHLPAAGRGGALQGVTEA